MSQSALITQQPRGWRRQVGRVAALVARLEPRKVAAVGGSLIVLFGVMGALYIRDSVFVDGGWVGTVRIGSWRIRGFNLDGESNLPTAYSALLLLGASALGLGVAATGRHAGIRARLVLPVALFLGFMALDEVWQLHERLEGWTNVDWQTLYAPLFLVAGIAALVLLPELRRHGPASVLFVVGAGAWAVAQALERIQWDGDALRTAWTIVPEETLEMAGSLLFLLAFLVVLRRTTTSADARRRADDLQA